MRPPGEDRLDRAGPRFRRGTSALLGTLMMLCGTLAVLATHAQKVGAEVDVMQIGSDINGMPGEGFGRQVALSGDGQRVASSGSPRDVPNFVPGPARVHEWDGDDWNQVGPDVGDLVDGFWAPSSLALSGDGTRIALGYHAVDGAGVNTGRVRVFDWNGADWTQVGDDVDGDPGQSLGFAVALSADGGRLAIGAPGGEDPGEGDALFSELSVREWDGERWTELTSIVDLQMSDRAGPFSVDMSPDGEVVAVGRRTERGGKLQVYRQEGTDWMQVGSDIEGAAGSLSLSADGRRLAAALVEGVSGTVQVLDWDGTAWRQVGGGGDGSQDGWPGAQVSLSSDGDRLAIGDPQADQARLYDWDGSRWTLIAARLGGPTAGVGLAGAAVAVSADGNRLAVGAPAADDGVPNAGLVRVFEIPAAPLTTSTTSTTTTVSTATIPVADPSTTSPRATSAPPHGLLPPTGSSRPFDLALATVAVGSIAAGSALVGARRRRG